MTKGTLPVEHPPAFLPSDLPGTQAVTLSSRGQDPASSAHRKGSTVEMKGARSFPLGPCPKRELSSGYFQIQNSGLSPCQ